MKTKLIDRLLLITSNEEIEDKLQYSPIYLITILAISNIVILKVLFELI